MPTVGENGLPPNVEGKSRGSFKIKIQQINWSSKNSIDAHTKTTLTNKRIHNILPKGKNPIINCIGSGGISIQFIWWGENIKKGISLKLNNSKLNEQFQDYPTINYDIRTKNELFQNYLKNCEPIDIKFSANTSNLQIGTTFAQIPCKIINNCCKIGEQIEEIGKYKIFSPRNNYLGDITIVFQMLFYSEQNSCTSLNKMITINEAIDTEIKENFNKTNIKDLNLDYNLKNLDSCRSSYKTYKNDYDVSLRNRTKSARLTSSSTLSSNVMNYLTGRKMSRNDEDKALEEIRCTSPLGSVVTELINNNHCRKYDNTYNRVDSLKLFIKCIHLTPAGIREISLQSLANISFTIECRISPNLLENVRTKYDYDVIRFYSDHFDDKFTRIDFNRDAIRSIRIAQNEFNSSIIEHSNLMFTIWWREFGSKYSRCLGTAKYRFTSLFEGFELEQTKILTIKSCTGNIYVGDIIARITLGTKGVHFGPDLLAIIQDNHNRNENIDEIPSSLILTPESSHYSNTIRTNSKIYDKNDTNNENSAENKKSNEQTLVNTTKSNQTTQTSARITTTKNINSQENSDGNQIELDKKITDNTNILLHGLLFVGSIRNVKQLDNGGYYLVCRAFWEEDATSTYLCEDNKFNFLEIFPIINDEKFLERTRNNHLILELWQTNHDTGQIVGVIKFPLHQFFIAFRDAAITKHLCQARLPVISADGWIPITSPLSREICGQLQGLLAIGTEEQLEYLKASRGFNFNRVSVFNSSDIQIPVPQVPKPSQNIESTSGNSCDAESQTNYDETSARRERLSDLLGTFIDNLAQKLPSDRTDKANLDSLITDNDKLPTINEQVGQIRRTSDLLDVLEKALVTPPTASINLGGTSSTTPIDILRTMPPIQAQTQTHLTSFSNGKYFKILLEIESALHLPRNPLKLANKKCTKRNSNAGKCKQSRFPADEEPSAYVTFQAEEGLGPMIKSHEGLVYATNVIEKSCSPVWGKRFEIRVLTDLLTNDEKRFILKIWRKAATDIPQCRLLPNPVEDSVIGFAAIDLSVLLARMPCISGWFNIVDFNGRINGQIKVIVQPLEDVLKFKESLNNDQVNVGNHCNENLQPITFPLPIDLDAGATSTTDLSNTNLSRAIKRKFTELEEITQRLKARLSDVTGEAESPIGGEGLCDNIIDDQLDEFERDLNTACEEDDDVMGQNYAWLDGEQFNDAQIDCSSSTNESQERIRIISDCLRKTSLEECNQRNLPEDGTRK